MKKIITLLLIAALSAGTAVMAEEVAEHDVLLISETEEAMPMFVESTVGAAKLYEEDGVKYVSAVDAYDQEVRFVLTEHTVIIKLYGIRKAFLIEFIDQVLGSFVGNGTSHNNTISFYFKWRFLNSFFYDNILCDLFLHI